MWWAKTAVGFRGWFLVETNGGSLRTGLVAGDFTVTVVNPSDTAGTAPVVSESSTKGGLYFFDVPTAFLTTNGIGEYGVVIEIDTFAGPSNAPNVRGTASHVLRVSLADLEEDRIVQGWVFDPISASLDVEFSVDRKGSHVILSSATASVQLFQGGSSVAGPITGLTPDANGFWRTSITTFTPLEATLISALVTVTDGSLVIQGAEVLSIPKFSN